MPDRRRPGGPGDPGRPGRKSYELREPRDMRNAGRPADAELAEDLLKALAVGVAGGIATIAGAKKIGEGLQTLQEEADRKAEEQREAYREAVRQATANDIEFEYETLREGDGEELVIDTELAEAETEDLSGDEPENDAGYAGDELVLSPEAPEERESSGELTLEAESIAGPEEIRIDDQEIMEERLANAMAEYDAAMDDAAGIE